MSKKAKSILKLGFMFKESPKKAGDRKKLFNNLCSLIEQERKSLPFEDIELKKKYVSLNTKELRCGIILDKHFPTRVLLAAPEDNITKGNDLLNKLVNYVNTVFGNFAKGAKISLEYYSPWKKTEVNIIKKIIGESRMAKINEHIKATLRPMSVVFLYSIKDREYIISPVFHKQEEGMVIFSEYTYKSTLPWDLLSGEYATVVECRKVVDNISKMET